MNPQANIIYKAQNSTPERVIGNDMRGCIARGLYRFSRAWGCNPFWKSNVEGIHHGRDAWRVLTSPWQYVLAGFPP